MFRSWASVAVRTDLFPVPLLLELGFLNPIQNPHVFTRGPLPWWTLNLQNQQSQRQKAAPNSSFTLLGFLFLLILCPVIPCFCNSWMPSNMLNFFPNLSSSYLEPCWTWNLFGLGLFVEGQAGAVGIGSGRDSPPHPSTEFLFERIARKREF